MISVEEARRTILDRIEPLGAETVTLGEAAGRVLAEPLTSLRNLPPADNSAMDGYGVRASDVEGASEASPVRLPVVGAQLAGGAPVEEVPPGRAARIMTGAPIPPGVDAVVMRELCDESDVNDDGTGTVAVKRAVPVGEAIRRMGEDVTLGGEVGRPGLRLTPGRINLLASAGHVSVRVHRRPVVAILASGDELKELGEPFTDDDILNSNAHAVAAAVRSAGAIPHLIGIAKDTLEDHRRKIDEAAFADALLTIGGVSMGTHDFVRPALEALGVTLDFWKVAMRPGKPLAFGRRGAQAIFGLPGNPVSSLVGFELFVRPALLKMMGAEHPVRRPVKATLVGEGMKKKKGVAFYARARAELGDEGFAVRLEQKQGSGQISGLAWANALCVLDVETEAVKDGDRVEVLLLGDEALHAAA